MTLPQGYHTITPRLVARDAEALVRFLRDAFGATGNYAIDHPTDVRIGDSLVMVSEAGPREPTSSLFYLYVDDADAIFHRALKAGATIIEPPGDMPWGDRRAIIQDPEGNGWQIATFHG